MLPLAERADHTQSATSISQTMIVEDEPAAAAVMPSGAKVTSKTFLPRSQLYAARWRLVARSHSRTVLSQPPDSSHRPSGLMLTQETTCVCPASRLAQRSPLSVRSQHRTP